uniref:Ribosomal protein L33 n=1 Tax=Gentiana crassuloides TaxID=53144 RepID=A0A8F4XG33_9GENT|nr:ribosomal protein L33 [Gentiana crassuloides]
MYQLCPKQHYVITSISRYIITQKNRHNTPNRLELIKFCPYCYSWGDKEIDRITYLYITQGKGVSFYIHNSKYNRIEQFYRILYKKNPIFILN